MVLFGRDSLLERNTLSVLLSAVTKIQQICYLYYFSKVLVSNPGTSSPVRFFYVSAGKLLEVLRLTKRKPKNQWTADNGLLFDYGFGREANKSPPEEVCFLRNLKRILVFKDFVGNTQATKRG